MVRKSVFDEVDGYDEAFAVGFNDVDFCFRVRETGRLVTFTPYAELFHYEFVSRGREAADAVKLERWKREQALFTTRWPEPFLEGDCIPIPTSIPTASITGCRGSPSTARGRSCLKLKTVAKCKSGAIRCSSELCT